MFIEGIRNKEVDKEEEIVVVVTARQLSPTFLKFKELALQVDTEKVVMAIFLNWLHFISMPKCGIWILDGGFCQNGYSIYFCKLKLCHIVMCMMHHDDKFKITQHKKTSLLPV